MLDRAVSHGQTDSEQNWVENIICMCLMQVIGGCYLFNSLFGQLMSCSHAACGDICLNTCFCLYHFELKRWQDASRLLTV
jgi:hypothetical protein